MMYTALPDRLSYRPGSETAARRSIGTPGRHSIDEALARVSLTRQSLTWNALTVRVGRQVALAPQSALLPDGIAEIETASIDEFKRWIGFDDDAIRDGTTMPAGDAQPAELAGTLAGARVLNDDQWSVVSRAAEAYLFSDSAVSAPFKPAIERYLGPFRAQVIVAEEIVLEPDAELWITGIPAVLAIDRLVCLGGTLCMSVVSRIVVGEIDGPPRIDVRGIS